MIIPEINNKSDHSVSDLKNKTLNFIQDQYNQSEWIPVYIDGSSEGAISKGGCRFLIQFQNCEIIEKALPCGKNVTNYQAEAIALLSAIDELLSLEFVINKVVFLSLSKSLLVAVKNPSSNKHVIKVRNALLELFNLNFWRASMDSGNERADLLSKEGSRMNP